MSSWGYGGTAYGTGSSTVYGSDYGTGWAGNTFVEEKVPYTLKNHGKTTPIIFNVMVDPDILKGRQVYIRGNLPVLGEWNNFGVPMRQLPSNPVIWTATVDLPFTLDEHYTQGLFEYKYCLETPGGKPEYEGGYTNRYEVNLTNIYQVWRKVYTAYAVGGWQRTAFDELTPIILYTREELANLQNNLITPAEFLQRFAHIYHHCTDVRRVHIEQVFDEYVQQPDTDLITTLCLMSCVGSYGISQGLLQTAASTATTTTASSGWTNVQTYGGYVYRPYVPPPPEPTPWCHAVLDGLQVDVVFQMKLNEVLGPKFHQCIKGLQEAAERVYRTGSFTWLRVFPLLEAHHCVPRSVDVSDKKKKERSTLVEEFQRVVASVRDMAAQCGGEALAPMACSWLMALIRYAPTIQAMADILLSGGLQLDEKSTVLAVARKVGVYVFGKTSEELQILRDLCQTLPFLLHPKIASEILDNDDADDLPVTDFLNFIQELTFAVPEADDELTEATKNWLRRNYQEELRSLPMMHATQAQNAINKAMRIAVGGWDDMIMIPCFASKPQRLLFEMGRGVAFKGDPSRVLKALCALASGNNSWSVYCPAMQEYLMSKALRAVEESAERPLDVFQIVQTMLEKDSLACSLLTALLLKVSGGDPQPSYASLLQNYTIWIKVFAWLEQASAPGLVRSAEVKSTELASMVAHVSRRIEALSESIATGACRLRDVHTVLDNASAFLDLCRSLDIRCINGAVLDERKEELRVFDTTLSQVLCYTTFFCHCGVPIDSYALDEMTKGLKANYDDLLLAEMRTAFNDVACIAEIPWLHALQGSELFIALWKQSGTAVLASKPEPIKAEAVADGADGGVAVGGGPPPPPPPPPPGYVPASVREDQQRRTCVMCGEVFESRNRLFAHVRERGEHFGPGQGPEVLLTIPGKVTILTQQHVLTLLIPMVREKWAELRDKVKNAVILSTELSTTFERLHDEQQCHTELLMLATTGSGHENPHEKHQPWVSQAFQSLQDYRLLLRLRVWVPAMLTLRDLLGAVFSLSPEQDEYLQRMQETNTSFATQWSELDLAGITKLVQPLRNLFSFQDVQLDFLAVLASSPALVRWVLEHPNTNDFNQLIKVCRPCTDEPRVLSSIASLIHVRTLLSVPMYTDNKLRMFGGLSNFLDSFQEANSTADDLWHLNNIAGSFEGLMDVFERQTRSPGIRACYDLQEIATRGVFRFQSSQDEAKVLVCQLAAKPTSGDEPEAESNRVSVKFLDELLDLRSKLVMTEVPEELDDLHNMRALLDKYVEALNILCEMKDVIVSLFRAGHFDFQNNYESNFRFDVELSVLQKALKSLQERSENWERIVQNARNSFYFLNFFNMRQVLHLNELACNLSQDGEPSPARADRLHEFTSLLWLVSAAVEPSLVAQGLHEFAKFELSENASDGDEDQSARSCLERLGTMLAVVFDSLPPVTRLLAEKLTRGKQADMLTCDDATQLPLFVVCAEQAALVLDVVLSIYARRGRLPESEELVFCTNVTPLEDIKLLLNRFIRGKLHFRQDRVYCLADIHLLPYATQCSVVDELRKVIVQCGVEAASTLVLVSGRPHQVIMNAFSSNMVELKPLSNSRLRGVLDYVGEAHSGSMMAVYSEMNGCGKTHYIRKWVSQKQLRGESVCYRHITFPETSNAGQLVTLLHAASAQGTVNVFHLDIGHIVPETVNTLLFELLVIGVVQDSKTTRVYHRNKNDCFLLEVANSPQDKTARSLRFCSLLPSKRLKVEMKTMDMTKPIFTDFPHCTQISCPDNSEVILVAKYLRAHKNGVFQPGNDRYNIDFHPWMDDDIMPDEAFTLLYENCNPRNFPTPPSWLVISNFVQFMNSQFVRLMGYGFLCAAAASDGLEHFKHVFISLLVRTSADYSLRSVADMNKTLTGGAFAPTAAAIAAVTAEDGTLAPLDRTESGESGPPAELGRVDSVEYVDRFASMISWEQSDHPVVLFYTTVGTEVSGVDIFCLNKGYVDQFIDKQLQAILDANGINFNRNWHSLKQDEAIRIIRKVEGTGMYGDDDPILQTLAIDPNYVLTVDNVMKIISIQLRLKYGLPVLIMGETGCGKSSLLSYACSIINVPMYTLNVHGGMTDEHIIAWMHERINDTAILAAQSGQELETVVVFFDEINTCNSMCLFKELLCDKSMHGERLPSNIKIIAACNPYRLRKGRMAQESQGLVFEHHNAGDTVVSGIVDPLKDLVYRVHPLPESMIDFVFDFGSLSEDTERLYIETILHKDIKGDTDTEPEPQYGFGQLGAAAHRHHEGMEAAMERPDVQGGRGRFSQSMVGALGFNPLLLIPKPSDVDEFMHAYSELLNASQAFVRTTMEDRSAVSLRDISRCIKVFQWFARHFASQPEANFELDDFFTCRPRARPWIRTSMVLSLSYCYACRLTREEQQQYRRTLADCWRTLGNRNKRGQTQYQGCRWLDVTENAFTVIVRDVQNTFVKQMNIGEGIALNEALCENLFMLLVSILNQIPIFVIGKPGSSKSLAMELIQSNLCGEASENSFLRTLPAVEVFSYQCSPLSTAVGIESTFDAARRYKTEAPNSVVVVLLDEVGLAEQSPHLPLKVLHKELECPDTSVVGISNWALDPANMNRAVHLYRPAPTVDDLCFTAEGMVTQANLKGYLHSLAKAYNTVYSEQESGDFWGLREFYSTVKFIGRTLDRANPVLDESILLRAVQRNFGGRPGELNKVISTFFSGLGMLEDRVARQGSVALVRDNLHDMDARHLMLLTKNNAALSLLFDYHILEHKRTQVIFGSEFPLDQTDLQICMNIQQIKLCMAEGITVVLVHCEQLFASLYDLLNQHYCEYNKKRYVRLAFGSHSKLCPIHNNFRVIVVVEKIDAYTRLPPPLLNRFEKQVFERQDVLSDFQKRIYIRLTRFVDRLLDISARNLMAQEREDGTEVDDDDDDDKIEVSVASRMALSLSSADARRVLCGFFNDMLYSLVLSLTEGDTIFSEEELQAAGDIAPVDNVQDKIIEMREKEKARENAIFDTAIHRLLWIATPEAVCSVMMSKKRSKLEARYHIDIPDLYFKKQSHSDLPTFATNVLGGDEARQKERMTDGWGDSLGAQVVAATYCPLTRNVCEILHSQAGMDASLVVLHELSSERDLMRGVKEFMAAALNAANPKGAMLIIQCDPATASFERISHAKYICENERQKFLKGDEAILPGGVHICMLIHLSRGMDSNFMFDFDTRWRNVFLDNLEPTSVSGLPDIHQMLGCSLTEIVESMNLPKVLMLTFRSALSRLVYPYERTHHHIRSQISRVLGYLENDAFLKVMQTLVYQLIKKVDDGGSSWQMLTAQQANSLALAGTFRAALHRHVSETVASIFAIIASHMDRNDGFALFGDSLLAAPPAAAAAAAAAAATASPEKPVASSPLDLSTMWLELFSQSFDVLQIFDIKGGSTSTTRSGGGIQPVEVTGDGKEGSPFSCQFPFSFFVAATIDSMRGVVDVSAPNASAALQQQIELVNLDTLASELPESLVLRYLHDYVCMHTQFSAAVPRAQQAEVVNNVLLALHHRTTGKALPLTRLSQVHAYSWKLQQSVETYLALCDAVPACTPSVANVLRTKDANGLFVAPGAQMDFNVVKEVLEHLKPHSLGVGADIVPWIQSFRGASARLDALFASLRFEASRIPTDAVKPTWAAGLADLVAVWEKLQYVQRFMQDVCVPLRIGAGSAVSLWDSVQAVPLRSHAALILLLTLLEDVNKQFSKGDCECVICLNIPTDPVRFCKDCGQLVCSLCLVAFQKSAARQGPTSRCFWCRRDTTGQKPEVREWDRELADRCMLRETQLIRLVRRFVEYYVFHFCLGNEEDEMEDELLVDIVGMFAGQKPQLPTAAPASEVTEVSKAKSFDVIPGAAMRPSLLRSLLRMSHPKTRGRIEEEVHRWLEQDVTASGLLDTDLCKCYVGALEDKLRESNADVLELADLQLSHLSLPVAADGTVGLPDFAAASVHARLATVARLRRVLDAFTRSFNPESADGGSGLDGPLRDRVDRLLTAALPCTRSVRLLLLKDIERLHGVSMVRHALLTPPLSQQQWVTQWVAESESALQRFLGSSRLPKHNPYVLEPLYATVAGALSAVLAAGDIRALADAVASLRGSPLQLYGTLILVFFHEIFLLYTLEAEPPAALDLVRNFVATLDFLSDSQKALLLLFTTKYEPRKSAGKTLNDFFGVNPSSSPKTILMLRVAIHAIASAMMARPDHPLYFLQTLMATPQTLADSFFPTMPDDARAALRAVLGGGWYTCPNGHTYYVDACGRPTEILKCAECGVEIGGKDHNLLDTNKQADTADETPRGYCVRADEDEQSQFISMRTLPPRAVRVIRILLHSALVVASAVNPSFVPAFVPLLNQAYCKPADVGSFFVDRFVDDWTAMRKLIDGNDDAVSMVMHQVLVSFGGHVSSLTAGAAGGGQPAPQAAGGDPNAAPVTGDWSSLKELPKRQQWETDCNQQHIVDVVDLPAARLVELLQQCSSEDQQGNVFLAELMETFSIDTMPLQHRLASLPGLFSYRRAFSMDHFRLQFTARPKGDEEINRFELLQEFLTREPLLAALRYIPDIVEWQRILLRRYNRRIDRKTAREMTVQDVLKELEGPERAAASEAFDGFQRAWALSWSKVHQVGCLVIPKDFREHVMDSSSPISFCIPDEKDEFICSLALLQFLVDTHNEFVQLASDVVMANTATLLAVSGGRKQQGVDADDDDEQEERNNARDGHQTISSSQLAQHHCVSYDLRRDVLTYVAEHCVSMIAGGDLQYDFARVQDHLTESLFSGLPLIELGARIFDFLGEQRQSGGRQALRAKVPQESLPQEVADSIKRELLAAGTVSLCYETVLTCISFLLATGGTYVQKLEQAVGDRTLIDYVKNVLLIPDADFGSRTVATQVSLKHVDALWALLESFSSSNDGVKACSRKYKDPLEHEVEEELQCVVSLLELTPLLQALRDLLVTQLMEEHLNANDSLSLTLGFMLSDDNDITPAWFTSYFPKSIKNRQAFETYNLLMSLAAGPE